MTNIILGWLIANYPYSQMIITPFKAIARQINFDQKIEELIFNYLDSHFIDACKCFIFRNPPPPMIYEIKNKFKELNSNIKESITYSRIKSKIRELKNNADKLNTSKESISFSKTKLDDKGLPLFGDLLSILGQKLNRLYYDKVINNKLAEILKSDNKNIQGSNILKLIGYLKYNYLFVLLYSSETKDLLKRINQKYADLVDNITISSDFSSLLKQIYETYPSLSFTTDLDPNEVITKFIKGLFIHYLLNIQKKLSEPTVNLRKINYDKKQYFRLKKLLVIITDDENNKLDDIIKFIRVPILPFSNYLDEISNCINIFLQDEEIKKSIKSKTVNECRSFKTNYSYSAVFNEIFSLVAICAVLNIDLSNLFDLINKQYEIYKQYYKLIDESEPWRGTQEQKLEFFKKYFLLRDENDKEINLVDPFSSIKIDSKDLLISKPKLSDQLIKKSYRIPFNLNVNQENLFGKLVITDMALPEPFLADIPPHNDIYALSDIEWNHNLELIMEGGILTRENADDYVDRFIELAGIKIDNDINNIKEEFKRVMFPEIDLRPPANSEKTSRRVEKYNKYIRRKKRKYGRELNILNEEVSLYKKLMFIMSQLKFNKSYLEIESIVKEIDLLEDVILTDSTVQSTDLLAERINNFRGEKDKINFLREFLSKVNIENTEYLKENLNEFKKTLADIILSSINEISEIDRIFDIINVNEIRHDFMIQWDSNLSPYDKLLKFFDLYSQASDLLIELKKQISNKYRRKNYIERSQKRLREKVYLGKFSFYELLGLGKPTKEFEFIDIKKKFEEKGLEKLINWINGDYPLMARIYLSNNIRMKMKLGAKIRSIQILWPNYPGLSVAANIHLKGPFYACHPPPSQIAKYYNKEIGEPPNKTNYHSKVNVFADKDFLEIIGKKTFSVLGIDLNRLHCLRTLAFSLLKMSNINFSKRSTGKTEKWTANFDLNYADFTGDSSRNKIEFGQTSIASQAVILEPNLKETNEIKVDLNELKNKIIPILMNLPPIPNRNNLNYHGQKIKDLVFSIEPHIFCKYCFGLHPNIYFPILYSGDIRFRLHALLSARFRILSDRQMGLTVLKHKRIKQELETVLAENCYRINEKTLDPYSKYDAGFSDIIMSPIKFWEEKRIHLKNHIRENVRAMIRCQDKIKKKRISTEIYHLNQKYNKIKKNMKQYLINVLFFVIHHLKPDFISIENVKFRSEEKGGLSEIVNSMFKDIGALFNYAKHYLAYFNENIPILIKTSATNTSKNCFVCFTTNKKCFTDRLISADWGPTTNCNEIIDFHINAARNIAYNLIKDIMYAFLKFITGLPPPN
ncbi:MAG: hypothetical protein ACTSO2_13205 [Promethearchaeota archaeon]